MRLAGWLANLLIIIGAWKMAEKWRHAFLFGIAGDVIYGLIAWRTEQYDLAFICVVFCLLAFRNWWKWGKA